MYVAYLRTYFYHSPRDNNGHKLTRNCSESFNCTNTQIFQRKDKLRRWLQWFGIQLSPLIAHFKTEWFSIERNPLNVHNRVVRLET